MNEGQTSEYAYENRSNSAPLSVGDYVIMYLLLVIPFVNLVLLFVWAFGSDVNLNRKNFARATLLIPVLSIALVILMVMIFRLNLHVNY